MADNNSKWENKAVTEYWLDNYAYHTNPACVCPLCFDTGVLTTDMGHSVWCLCPTGQSKRYEDRHDHPC